MLTYVYLYVYICSCSGQYALFRCKRPVVYMNMGDFPSFGIEVYLVEWRVIYAYMYTHTRTNIYMVPVHAYSAAYIFMHVNANPCKTIGWVFSVMDAQCK